MIPGQAQQFFEGAAAAAGGDFQIDRSLRFNSADSAYLNRTPSSASNRKTWTWSGWVKLCKNKGQVLFHSFSAQNDSGAFFIDYLSSGSLRVLGWSTGWRYTSQLFRDFSAWQHVVVAVDTTNATANDRIKIYVNGTQITQFDTFNNPSQDAELAINQAALHRIGNYTDGSNNYDYFDGYLANVHFIDGQALAPTAFGKTNAATGVWEPKEFAGEYKPANIDNWPSMTTGTPFNSDYSIASLFDGSLSTYMCPAAGTSCVFTPTTPIAVSSSIRIYGIASSSNEYFKINDTVVTNVPNSAGWFTPNIGSTITSLNKFEFYTTSGSYAAIVRAIEIDGQILTTGGINSFALNFSDNSSNAALGTDSSGNNNTWTVNNLTAAANYGLTTAAQIVGTSKTFSFPTTGS